MNVCPFASLSLRAEYRLLPRNLSDNFGVVGIGSVVAAKTQRGRPYYAAGRWTLINASIKDFSKGSEMARVADAETVEI